jgi:hypothetical protein
VEDKIFDIEGSPELIQKLAANADSSGVEHSEPVSTESLADPLQAPIGGPEVKEYFELLVLLFKTAAAAAGFFGAIRNVLKDYEGQPLTVKDRKTGKVTKLTSETSEAEIREAFKQ